MDSMIYDPTKPSEIFNDLVGNKIKNEIARGVVSQYILAYEHCYGSFAQTEAHDLLPDYRRACIEGIMPDLAERIGGYTVKSKKNKAKNCWHRLILSNCIILTQSKVEQREKLPRDATFRKGYAESNQMLFDFMNEGEVSEFDLEAPLYAIIVHLPANDNKRLPEFVDIVFPNENYREIVGRIKLLYKFPDIISEKFQEEIIPDMADTKLKHSVKKTDIGVA